MKTGHLLAIILVATLSINALASDKSHTPRRKGVHRHSREVIVVPPPRRVVVMPPPRPVVIVPAPRAYVRTGIVYAPTPNRISSREAIRNAKNIINNQRFEADRLRAAKDAAYDLPITSLDVLDIMNMFSYESSRLDFAKFAYNKTVDNENYSIVFEGFKYTSSIRDLEDFIYGGR